MNARSLPSPADGPDTARRRVIIATTEPHLFTRSLAPQINRSVYLFHRGGDAIESLLSTGCDAFYADFRQLEDRWTGQRFLRYIRERSELAHVQFWLMAENWYPSQEQWAVKCGAAGMVKRSPPLLAASILGEAPQLPLALELQLDAVDEVFARFAGPMSPVHAQAAREAMEAGRIDASRDAYVQALSSHFNLDERRDAFLKALWADVELNLDVDTTQPGDPWMTEVNKVFRRYAGALGARLIISRTLEVLDRQGKHERSFYLNELSSGLANPMRRADFLSAARDARLIS